MSDAGSLYQELILDHGRRPRNFRALESPSLHAVGNNPLCGDQVTVYARVANGVVKEATFTGQGCAISQASTSLMTEAIRGKTVAEVESLFGRFHDLVTGHGGNGTAASGSGDPGSEDDEDMSGLGKLRAFSGVGEFPMRVKCATLAWHTLRAALAGADKPVSTE